MKVKMGAVRNPPPSQTSQPATPKAQGDSRPPSRPEPEPLSDDTKPPVPIPEQPKQQPENFSTNNPTKGPIHTQPPSPRRELEERNGQTSQRQTTVEDRDREDSPAPSVITSRRQVRTITTAGHITTDDVAEDEESSNQSKAQNLEMHQEKQPEEGRTARDEQASQLPVPAPAQEQPRQYYKVESHPGAVYLADNDSQGGPMEYVRGRLIDEAALEEKPRHYTEPGRYYTREIKGSIYPGRFTTPAPDRSPGHYDKRYQPYPKPGLYASKMVTLSRYQPQQIILTQDPGPGGINGEIQTIAYQADQRDMLRDIGAETTIIAPDQRVIITESPSRYQDGSPMHQTIQYTTGSPMLAGQISSTSPHIYQHSDNIGSPSTMELVHASNLGQQAIGITIENGQQFKYEHHDPNVPISEQKSTTYTNLMPVTSLSSHPSVYTSGGYITSPGTQYQSLPPTFNYVTKELMQMYPIPRGNESPPNSVLYRDDPILASSSLQHSEKAGTQIVYSHTLSGHGHSIYDGQSPSSPTSQQVRYNVCRFFITTHILVDTYLFW